MEQKLKVATYGACHAHGVRDILRAADLDGQLSLRDTASCYLISDEQFADFRTDLANQDILLYQPISAAYRGEAMATARLLESCGPQTTAISFQYFHFELYAPFTMDPVGGLTAPPLDYMNYHLAAMIVRGLDDTEILDRLQNEVCFAPYADQLRDFCFVNLRDREARILPGERSLDVVISDFVEDNFQSSRLCHTHNHPTAAVLYHVIDGIFDRKPGLQSLKNIRSNFTTDPLNLIQFPVPAFVRRAFDLQFVDGHQYFAQGRVIPAEEYVDMSRKHFLVEGKEKVHEAIKILAVTRPWYGVLLAI